MKRDLIELPDDARLWVFGTDRALSEDDTRTLASRLDAFLEGWTAHRVGLVAGAAIEERRFLLVAVDEARAAASGCSIDALLRAVGDLEHALDVRLRDGGVVFYRDPAGEIVACERAEFRGRGAAGAVTGDTPVFDLTIDRLGDWRDGRFERTARSSWHARLLPAAEAAGARRPG